MSSRSFEHPMHRHPAVAPVLQLIDSAPDASLGRGGLHALIVQLRALHAIESWAMDRFGLVEAPGYAEHLVGRAHKHAPTVDNYARLPEHLASVHRADEHDPVLTETARRASLDGPDAARAFVRACRRPSLAARRVAAQGWWPALAPAFIGRLDDEVHPDAYAPNVPLAAGLAERQRWRDAWTVAQRLKPKAARVAGRAIVRQRAVVGLGPDGVPAALRDEYLWHSARRAAARLDGHAAETFVGDIEDPRLRILAAHEVRHRLGQLEPLRAPAGAPLDHVATGVHVGAALLMQADLAIEAARPTDAWTCLVAAATAPRLDRRYWTDGVRPDLRIAQQLLLVSLKFAYAGRWPWGRRHQRALLDRLDAVRPVLAPFAHRHLDEAIEAGAVRGDWLKARLRQALYVRAMERVDRCAIERHLRDAPQAEAFVRGLLGDGAFDATLPPDPTDPLRNLYHDGQARRARAARRPSLYRQYLLRLYSRQPWLVSPAAFSCAFKRIVFEARTPPRSTGRSARSGFAQFGAPDGSTLGVASRNGAISASKEEPSPRCIR